MSAFARRTVLHLAWIYFGLGCLLVPSFFVRTPGDHWYCVDTEQTSAP